MPRYVAKNPDRGAADRVVLENPTHVERIYTLLSAVDDAMSPPMRESWRWQLLFLRAQADRELVLADGYISDRCDQLLRTLESLYHTDASTLYTVTPATREGLRKRFDDPHSEYYV